jgi:hypothetical protein
MASFMVQRLQITARHGRGVRAKEQKLRKRAGAVAMVVAALNPALAAAPEPIGSWILNCADAACVLRHKDRFFSKGGVTAGMEVQAVGKDLVPIIALRGLPNDMLLASSMAGKAEASIQFPGAARVDLACAIGDGAHVCAPRADSLAVLAAALPTARSVTVRGSVSMSGLNPLPVRERSLELVRTKEALARLRVVGAPSSEPSGWVSLLDRGLKATGYKNGTADLPGLVAGYLGR